jgi:hypothetical protein
MNPATTKFYRASSVAEWADIQTFGGFRSLPSSMQGHWFAESAADAARWCSLLYPAVNQPFVIVEVEVPTAAADLLFRLPKLDNIGPARFADDGELVIFNHAKVGPIQGVVHAQPRAP